MARRIQDAVVAVAHHLLAEVVGADDDKTCAQHTASGQGWRVTVIVTREQPTEALTQCQRHILETLAATRQRLTTSAIRDRLVNAGHLHGDATVSRALADLVRRGILLSNRKAPRGYTLANSD